MENNKDVNAHFLSLIMMLATAAWQQLGKIPNPVSGKNEQDLKGAQITIDMLSMIKDKTKGNLSPEEEKHMVNVLSVSI